MSVNGTMQRVDGTIVRMPPKSEKGHRVLPVPPSLSSMLRKHKAEQNQRRFAAGAAWCDTDLVFDRRDGGAIDPDLLGKAFIRARTRAGVSGIRLHDLRHPGSRCRSRRGIDIATVSDAAGHSNLNQTRAYTHPASR